MLRQSSSRNQRSKGFKIKHGLQISLLIAVCVWLLYQVKHSHDNRQAFDESGAGISEKVEEARHDVFSLGRKDISDRIQMVTDRPKEDREEEEEEDEGRREVREEEEEEEGRREENEEEERGVGDDEIDERDQEKIDEDAEQEEELLDGEDEKDNEGEKDGHFGDMDALETQEHDNGDAGLRDGLSSSHGLIHDTQIISSDIAKSEQEKAADVEGSNEPDPHKDKETIDATSLQTITEKAAIKENEPRRNSSELHVVLREGEAVGDASHNATGNGEVGGVKLSVIQDESNMNLTGGESKERTELHDSSASENTETPVSVVRAQSITFSESQYQNTTLSEFQGQNATLSETQNQNRTLTEEQREKTDADSGGGETDENLESREVDESEDENSWVTQEEGDALTDLETFSQREHEEENTEAISAE